MMELVSIVLSGVDAVLGVIFASLSQPLLQVAEGANNTHLLGIDMSIDGLRSKEYSYYIFGFLVASLILFSYIIYLYMPKKLSSLKTGEKIMFGALVFGIVIAIIIGYVQLIEGYLI
ncbi:MAG: hypothetical protein OEW58_02895 [Gammaproteobacteria bacterium]|nr:hypothetical protein [Gammaproteobacteria bacterium]